MAQYALKTRCLKRWIKFVYLRFDSGYYGTRCVFPLAYWQVVQYNLVKLQIHWLIDWLIAIKLALIFVLFGCQYKNLIENIGKEFVS